MKDKKWMRKALSFLLAVFMVTGSSAATMLTAAAEESTATLEEVLETTEDPEATSMVTPEVTATEAPAEEEPAAESPEATPTTAPEVTATEVPAEEEPAAEPPEATPTTAPEAAATEVPAEEEPAAEAPEATPTAVPEAPEEVIDEEAVDYGSSVLKNEHFSTGFVATFGMVDFYEDAAGERLVGRVSGVLYMTGRPQKDALNERVAVCVNDRVIGVTYGYLAADAVHPVSEKSIADQCHTGVFANGVEMPYAALTLAETMATPEPTEAPVVEPTEAPVVEPTEAPVVEPTEAPVVEPTEAPVVEPTEAPVVEPTEVPVVEPTEVPVVEPTEAPVVEPTEAPAVEPTEAPVVEPTEAPAVEPTEAPAVEPTEAPVVEPTEAPVVEPTEAPAVEPTEEPDHLENIDRADVVVPAMPTFTMSKTTAALGENIVFTIHTQNATKILMYIDGSVNRYIYDVPTDTTTMTMSFSSMGSNGGKRTIAFQAYNGNTPGPKSATQTITLTKPVVKPQVTLASVDKTTVGLGENITFVLNVKNATKVLMYIDGSVNRRFEDITPDMTEYKFTMSFSSLGANGGKRTIMFQAYNGTTAGDKSAVQTVTVANESPNKPTVTGFTMNKSTVDLNENITFSINTKNATKMRVYIDGKLNRYIYDVKDGTTSFTMAFSSMGDNGGVRTIAFQPFNGNTPGAMSVTKSITISVANKPQVELVSMSSQSVVLGENITIKLRIKNATKVLVYIDGSVNRRFENITPDMTEYTFTMSFSSIGANSGKRTMAFQAYNGTIGGDKTAATAITVTTKAAKPEVTSFTMDMTRVKINVPVTFTINTKNATKVVLYVDGKANTSYPTTGDVTVIERAFASMGSGNGVRTIQFKPYYGTVAGDLSPVQLLTIYAKDEFTVQVSEPKQGEALTVSWTQQSGAAKYQLLLTLPDGRNALQWDIEEPTILSVTLQESDLLQAGEYTIEVKAFFGIAELASATVKFTVVSDFSYAELDDASGIVLVRYTGTAATVVVPNAVAGLPVVAIGEQAFEGNTNIKSVTLPATIEIIGYRAFAACTNLQEIK